MSEGTGRTAPPAPPPPSRGPRALRPLRHRRFALLAGSAAASLLADGIWAVAGVWQVIALGGGPADMSVVATAMSLGLVAAVLLGGVAADRLPRRAVLVAVEAVRSAVPVAAGVLALAGALGIGELAALALVMGTAAGFYYPAWSAVVPTLLPPDELLAANGLEGMFRPLAQRAAGPALAGVLVAAHSPGAALLGAGAASLAALLPLLAMRPLPAPGPPDAAAPSVRRQLAEGFAYLFRTGWLFATLAFAVLYVLVVVGPIEVLLPFAVRDRAGGGPAALSLVLAAYGVGSGVGALVVSSLRLPRRYLTVMLLCWGLGALPLAVFGLATALWIMVVAAFVVGFTDATAGVIWGTLLQRRVPPHLLGRVSSLDFFVSLALMPLSMALAGPVGERIGIPAAFLVAAVVPPVLAAAAIVAWRLPRDEVAHPLDHGRTGSEPARSTVARAER